MTAKEKEIRAHERKIIADTRRVRRELYKQYMAMTPEEREEYDRKLTEELIAEGFDVVSSLV